MITNLLTPVNGPTTSEDYLSIFTTNYKDSTYIVDILITVRSAYGETIMHINKPIYFNYYISCLAKSNKLFLKSALYYSSDP